MEANLDYLEQIIIGFFRGDGTHKGGVYTKVSATTTSEALAHQLKFLLLKLKYVPAVKRVKTRRYNQVTRDRWDINLYGSQANRLKEKIGWPIVECKDYSKWFWVDENNAYIKILNTSTVNYKGRIFDLKISNSHSFAGVGAIFHNTTYDERPYPVSGDYFTGPWGPLTPALNTTIGRLLKPQKNMHEDEMAQALASYQPIGESGMYDPGMIVNSNTDKPAVPAVAPAIGEMQRGQLASNSRLMAFASSSLGTTSRMVQQSIGSDRERLMSAAGTPSIGYGSSGGGLAIGTDSAIAGEGGGMGGGAGTGIRPEILEASSPISRTSVKYQASELGYRTQELFGIYGFGFGTAREYLGYGNQDMSPSEPVMQSSTYAFGSSRGFWDLNIGGVGDLPTPFEGSMANLEFSEIMRRFIPKERKDVNYINPLENSMGKEHPWLPGPGNIKDFKHGDPYDIEEGEIRLPGQAYDRLHDVNRGPDGEYSLIDQMRILGDISQYSNEYKEIDAMVGNSAEANKIREQVAAKSKKHEFKEYEYKYSSPEELGVSEAKYAVGNAWERFKHLNTYFHKKFVPDTTAVEDWERNNVYGSTFPSWGAPIEDFIKPIYYNNSQRNPFLAGLATGVIGSMFGVNAASKSIGASLGAITGLGSSLYLQGKEKITGDRFMPEHREKELMVEENRDILEYLKNTKLSQAAQEMGDSAGASEYQRQAGKTMYGANLQNINPVDLVQAIPKRKREHFIEMVQAPEQEREAILSTAPRLERRMYQAAWGMPVEDKPDLGEYFQEHELPSPDSDVWHPQTSMDDIQIKIAQSTGLDLAQMGYYPQQIAEANRINPSYPNINRGQDQESEIRKFLRDKKILGDVTPVYTPGAGGQVSVYGGR